MRKLVLLTVLLCSMAAAAPRAFAVEGSEVRLRSSTVPGTKPDAIGAFDITSTDKLTFTAPGSAPVAIPYSGITAFTSSSELAHHFGVGGTVVVGILKKRQRLHFLTVIYRENDVTQVASFEVSKVSADVMASLLHAKAPTATENKKYEHIVQ